MPQVELVILAGGASSRMGSDKLRLRGQDGGLLIARWFDQLKWPELPRLVLPPGGIAPDELSHWPIAHDAEPGEGPLRGVAAALAVVKEWALIVAVDTPGIGRTQIDWLIGHIANQSSTRCWMMRRPSGLEPLPLLIHKDLLPAVMSLLGNPASGVKHVKDNPLTHVVESPASWPEGVWLNLNRPEDLSRFLKADESASTQSIGRDRYLE